jgi:hypothetical protein
MSSDSLILHAQGSERLSYYDDWIDGFTSYNGMSIKPMNVFNMLGKSQQNKIENARVIILHHSVTADTNDILKQLMAVLQARKGMLFAFVGNEVNLLSFSMSERLALLKQIQPEYILTQLLQEAGEWLYQDCFQSQVLSIPHALNTQVFKPVNDWEGRSTDLGVRSARYPIYVGDNDRNDLLRYFLDNPMGFNLDIKLSNDEYTRFTRDEWAQFLNQIKMTLATEAGSFFLARDDQLRDHVRDALQAASSRHVITRVPAFAKTIMNWVPLRFRHKIKLALGHVVVSAHDIDERDAHKSQALIDKHYPKTLACPVYSKAISSRHFDAIGTKTLQIMFPGRYNDILHANEHYIALNRDFSNIDQVMSWLNHPHKAKKMVEEAYQHVLKNHTHAHRVKQVMAYL